jgi:hypothetical protein
MAANSNNFVQRVVGTAVLSLSPVLAQAQCSMCRAVSGSGNLADEGFTPGRGLNDAILYLMAMPYVFALVFVLVFFRKQIYDRLRSGA